MKLLCVMVIDDSDADQFMSEIILKEYNPDIEILQAYDGVEALEMLKSAEKLPDLILLDINMPRMNGFEFLEEYCSEKNKIPHAPVVVMLTSSAQGEDKEKAKTHKCVKHYLEKPFVLLNTFCTQGTIPIDPSISASMHEMLLSFY